MREQRSPDGASPTRDALSRRDLLAGGAAIAGAAIAGCGSVRGGEEPVTMLVAGSLHDAVENGLRAEVDAPLRIEARGSAALARMVAEGQKDPDVVSVADVALFREPLTPSWYAEFATNAIVLAYDASSAGGARIAEVGPDDWYEPLRTSDVVLGRTDPDLDPLGYRTRFALDLAARYYDEPGLRERVTDDGQIYPETGLLAAFETGSIDAAFAYRSMAVDRGYDYVSLPPEIDLSDPAYEEEWYGTTAYDLPDGTTVEGSVIRYASALRHGGNRARSAFATHVGDDYLTDFGFVVPEHYPRYRGDVPDSIA